DAIIDAYNLLSNQRSGFIFLSQKGHVFVTQSINRRLKSIFPQKNKNISSHSLRKSFGRRVWTNNNESESSLIKLSEIFNHSSIKITRTYLGITQDEIEDVYMNL
ncbi:tyrosine-type recombinase/integrase, partial [bacterium]|nr:tyrosine-type recombinase/integrase [bacterium]